MEIAVIGGGFAFALILGSVLGLLAQKKQIRQRARAARAQGEQAIETAKITSKAEQKRLETEARTELLGEREQREKKNASRLKKQRKNAASFADREAKVGEFIREVDEADTGLTTRHENIAATRKSAKSAFAEADEKRTQLVSLLEDRAGVDSDSIIAALGNRWREEAQVSAARAVRVVEQSAADSSYTREAERLLNVAASRYQNHFMTERLISNVPVAEGVAEILIANDEQLLGVLQEVANVKLNISEEGTAIRLEGLDGVGREVARRALSKLSKKQKAVGDAQANPTSWAEAIRDGLHREILGLGRKAFDVLQVERAHPEIIDLVGRLNYRTSYTQNQWRHAVEASFLCGMMASEMGLDVKLARRATLMHDIGKALTHEIDGSHAVIGAEIARRLGEPEIVANAIGAHHLDEPMNSAYAHLVAAADAMSGARPGARREQSDGFSGRIQELERLAKRHRGVENCFAVHGGRELRVYVRENDVTDMDAVNLSSEIAEQISEELVFPGQIKVTVIRATEAVATTR